MSGIYVSDPAPRNAALELTGNPSLTSGTAFGTAFDEGFYYSPTASLLRGIEQQESHQGEVDPTQGIGRAPPRRLEPTSPLLSQKDANELYGIPGELTFDKPVRKAEAELLSRWKRDELKRQNILGRADPGVLPNLARLGGGFLGSAVDPLNVASAFIPVLGEARFLQLSARFGLTSARLARGALEGFVGAAAVEPIILLQAQSQQADYDAYDSIINLAFGTALGGGLHAGFGKVSDWIKGQPIELRETALRGAVAAVAEDRPVTVEGLMAWHGSPHEFDAFSMGKIDTGEGSQAFGHGLYFAERRGVAGTYKTVLSGDPFPAGDVRNGAWHFLNRDGEDAARNYLKMSLPSEEVDRALADVKATKRGNLYQARLKVSKEDLLDWDKPLSEQPEKVRKALEKAGLVDPVKDASLPGRVIYDRLAEEFVDSGSPRYLGKGNEARINEHGNSPSVASEQLAKIGIPGLQYLDGTSRKAGEGTRNFVMFDDSLIDIVSRNDQPIPGKVAEAQRATYQPNADEAAQARNTEALAEGWDQPITPETGADEAAELIEATNESVQAAKRSGDLDDRDIATIEGDPEVEKMTKGRAAAYQAASACLARVA